MCGCVGEGVCVCVCARVGACVWQNLLGVCASELLFDVFVAEPPVVYYKQYCRNALKPLGTPKQIQ